MAATLPRTKFDAFNITQVTKNISAPVTLDTALTKNTRGDEKIPKNIFELPSIVKLLPLIKGPFPEKQRANRPLVELW